MGGRESSIEKCSEGYFLAVQWLGVGAFIAEGVGSIPGRGTKIPQAMQRSQKEKEKLKKKCSEDKNYASRFIFSFCLKF